MLIFIVLFIVDHCFLSVSEDIVMTFQQLNYLVEISKCGSINKAAQKLFLSQSGISIAIKELEEELGITFFIRTNRGVTFTPEGREFLSHAVSLLDSKKQLEKLYSGAHGETASTFASISSQRYPFVEDAFLKLIRNHENSMYRMELRETGMDGVIDDVYDRRSDVGIIFLSDLTSKIILRLLSSRDLEFTELQTVPAKVYMRVGHPLSKLEQITESDLARYPYVSFEQSEGVAIDFSEECQFFNAQKPARRIVINTRSAATDIVANTDAITTGTGLLVKGISTDGVISLPIAGLPEIHLGWLHIRGSRVDPVAQEFISLLDASVLDAVEYTERITKEALDKNI
jgi:DNA-binding transcriptional LysR family regulator